MSFRLVWTHTIDKILRRPGDSRAGPEVAVLAVMPSESDRDYLKSLAGRSGWDLIVTADCAAALSVLRKREVPIILCDRDLPNQNWRDSVKTLVASVVPPCVILTSSVNDSYLWRELVQHGGYDVLSKPFQEDQVVSMVRRAWVFWKASLARPHQPS